LLPLTYTRPVADIRFGILTIREKWEKYLNASTSSITEDYLQDKFPVKEDDVNLLINGSVCPTTDLVDKINNLDAGNALLSGSTLIACALNKADLAAFDPNSISELNCKNYDSDLLQVSHLWDVFSKNGQAIEQDYKLLTAGKKSHTPGDTNQVLGSDLFIEEGTKIKCVTINTSAGPVYIGKNAEIMEGAHIRGPFALCNNSVVKMAAKIYGPTTIGPYSKVGGEISNCVILGHSNKAHDGFLGNSVIGEWCNLGADTNCSNLKNNYGEVKLWNYNIEDYEHTGLIFCGLIMGDHSKCGINTMFNTGTVVGVNANIFGSGFPKKFIPSFSWGEANGYTTYEFSKAIDVAKQVYKRRDIEMSNADEEILRHIFENTELYRKFDR